MSNLAVSIALALDEAAIAIERSTVLADGRRSSVGTERLKIFGEVLPDHLPHHCAFQI